MISFRRFLTESEKEGAKLKHITHPEDRPIMHGADGFNHAHGALMRAHQHMKAGKNDSRLTTKYDGSPAVIFGTHPKTKKFFVASKSAFNKTPKINHTPADIDKNHGHAPGLAAKLKAALKHLPKVTPPGKVYQGDIMHSKGDVKHDKKTGLASFTPNTLTYTAAGDEAKKAARAKIGVAVHTRYHGFDLQSMTAHHEVDHSEFKQHPDVHHHDASHDTSKISHTPKNQGTFQKHLAAAEAIHDKHGHEMYDKIHPNHSGEKGHLSTYINSAVKTGENPSTEGFKKHLKVQHDRIIGKIKSETTKRAKNATAQAEFAHVDKHKKHYENLFKVHKHLGQAKNALVSSLESGTPKYQHHIAGKESKPEGFVVHHDHGGKIQPTKLVNRSEFSKANLLKRRPGR